MALAGSRPSSRDPQGQGSGRGRQAFHQQLMGSRNQGLQGQNQAGDGIPTLSAFTDCPVNPNRRRLLINRALNVASPSRRYGTPQGSGIDAHEAYRQPAVGMRNNANPRPDPIADGARRTLGGGFPPQASGRQARQQQIAQDRANQFNAGA